MNSSILETPGGTRRPLTPRELRILRLGLPQEKRAMPRTRYRTITIRLCSMDRAVGAFLWAALAGLVIAFGSWLGLESIQHGKDIVALRGDVSAIKTAVVPNSADTLSPRGH